MAAVTFTPAQADAIRAPLLKSRLPPSAIEHFLEVAAIEAGDWRERWPPLEADQLRDGKRRLDDLRRHLDGLHYQLNTLDTAWKIPLWLRVQDRADSEVQAELLARPAQEGMQAGWHRTGRMVERLINDLRAAVAEQLDAIEAHNGRNNARKADLAERLAWTFHGAFGKAPATTPDGAFMGAGAAVAEALNETIGKDALAAGIKAWRDYRAFWFGPDSQCPDARPPCRLRRTPPGKH